MVVLNLISEVQRNNWSFKHFKLKVIKQWWAHKRTFYLHTVPQKECLWVPLALYQHILVAEGNTQHHILPEQQHTTNSQLAQTYRTQNEEVVLVHIATSCVRIRISTTSHARVRINITSHDVTLFQSFKSVCTSHKMCNKAVYLRVSPCVLKLATC